MEGVISPFHVSGNWKLSRVDVAWLVLLSVDVVWSPIEIVDVVCDSTDFVSETCSVVSGPFAVGLRNHQDQSATAAIGISFMNDLLLIFTCCPAELRCCQLVIFSVIDEDYLHHSWSVEGMRIGRSLALPICVLAFQGMCFAHDTNLFGVEVE